MVNSFPFDFGKNLGISFPSVITANGENLMSRDDWGIKRVCLSCGTRFYDFNKSPIICPTCGAVFDPEYLLKRKTKNSQEKSDDIIDDIDTVVEDGDLIDESGDDLEDTDDDIVLNDEKS
jgi:uncharacterized protein (TIGR02300 family)